MKSEIRSKAGITGTNSEAQTVPMSNSRAANMSVESILVRNDRVFTAFVGVGLLIAVLIIVVIFLRWDF
jgi:uncharacterized membrane protein